MQRINIGFGRPRLQRPVALPQSPLAARRQVPTDRQHLSKALPLSDARRRLLLAQRPTDRPRPEPCHRRSLSGQRRGRPRRPLPAATRFAALPLCRAKRNGSHGRQDRRNGQPAVGQPPAPALCRLSRLRHRDRTLPPGRSPRPRRLCRPCRPLSDKRRRLWPLRAPSAWRHGPVRPNLATLPPRRVPQRRNGFVVETERHGTQSRRKAENGLARL